MCLHSSWSSLFLSYGTQSDIEHSERVREAGLCFRRARRPSSVLKGREMRGFALCTIQHYPTDILKGRGCMTDLDKAESEQKSEYGILRRYILLVPYFKQKGVRYNRIK